MLPPAAVAALACPHCRGPLRQEDRVLGCGEGHRFDIARQGYVALLGPRSRLDTADSADMVAAREQFLGGGYYQPIAGAVAEVVTSLAPAPVLEIGAGTGYYLRSALGGMPRGATGSAVGVALDSSKYAARRSAASRVLSVVADAWSPLPVRDAAVGAVLSVFAPRDPAEIARVLVPGGLLIAVTPEPEHLHEIALPVGLLGIDAGKAARLEHQFAGLLSRQLTRDVRYSVELDHESVSALVRMGPSARHLTADELTDRVSRLRPSTTVTVAVTLSVLRRLRP